MATPISKFQLIKFSSSIRSLDNYSSVIESFESNADQLLPEDEPAEYDNVVQDFDESEQVEQMFGSTDRIDQQPQIVKCDMSLVMKITNRIKRKQQNFNPITDYASVFISMFERNLSEYGCVNLAIQILANFLDLVGLNFYHQVLSFKASIEWSEFKAKFILYFNNYKIKKTKEALDFKYAGLQDGSLAEFCSKKIQLLTYVYPTITTEFLITATLAAMPAQISDMLSKLDFNRTEFLIEQAKTFDRQNLVQFGATDFYERVDLQNLFNTPAPVQPYHLVCNEDTPKVHSNSSTGLPVKNGLSSLPNVQPSLHRNRQFHLNSIHRPATSDSRSVNNRSTVPSFQNPALNQQPTVTASSASATLASSVVTDSSHQAVNEINHRSNSQNQIENQSFLARTLNYLNYSSASQNDF